MEPYVVRKHIRINADVSKVWNALTDPEMTRQYFFGCKVNSDWKKGSDIVFKRKFLLVFPFELKGKILEFKPHQKLKYTLKNSSSKSFSTVTDELVPVEGGTLLSITDDVGQGEHARSRYRRSLKGWDKTLKGLKELLEKPSSKA